MIDSKNIKQSNATLSKQKPLKRTSLYYSRKKKVFQTGFSRYHVHMNKIYSVQHIRKPYPHLTVSPVNAETGLIDHLIHIAKTGSPEEKEKLKEFIQSFSEGINNYSIHLSDEAMEKYQTMLSVSMAYLPFDDVYEITDISASHVNGISALMSQEPISSELPLNQTDPGEVCLENVYHDIQSLYDIEDTPSDGYVGEETTPEDTLPSDISVSSGDLIEIYPLTEPVIQEKPSSKPDLESICTTSNATDSVDDEILPQKKPWNALPIPPSTNQN